VSEIITDELLKQLKQDIAGGGGIWVGVQQGFQETGVEPCVLFNDPNPRYGSTMALKVSRVTVQSVQQKIKDKRAEFRGVKNE
jgi:hypothetical protein